jgi:hypothetical protein
MNEDTRVKRIIAKAENHPLLSVVLLAFIVVMAVLGMANSALQVAERAGLMRATPRPASAPLPIGYVEPSRLVPADSRLELFASSAVVLKDGETPIVVFSFDGFHADIPIDPSRKMLIANFGVQIRGRKIGGALGTHVRVESVYPRTQLESNGSGILEVVEGDVLTILDPSLQT